MPKFTSEKRKKRRFSGNRYTKRRHDEETVNTESSNTESAISSDQDQPNIDDMASGSSASFRKLQPSIQANSNDNMNTESAETVISTQKGITGFRFCDMEIVSNVFSLLRCSECGDFSLLLEEDEISRKGCASSLHLLCHSCGWKHLFWTSKRQGKSFEVNRRLVYSMRRIGKGHTGASKFCSLMNIPSPPTAKSFRKTSRVVGQHLKIVAEASMRSAAEEVRTMNNESPDQAVPINCGISCDGTWQRRGYSSLNGCVTVISMDTGKVLDVEALSTICKQCKQHEHMDKNSGEYQRWKADHTSCTTNFHGSAPAMEPEGANRIFQRSVEMHKLRYTDFYGDGDSKSFSEVKETYQADGIEVVKKECIGHVQKRVGTALRKLKQQNPGLGGKGKLTNAMIDKLQNYYGIAIRSNVGNLDGMTKAVHASLFHCASNEAKPYHTHCPVGSDSWCRYQQDQANGTKLHKHGAGLPLEVIAKVKPEYRRLSEKSLLEKCLHGKTQNQNEALNGLIWQRIPKEVFVYRDTLEFGMYDAVAHFNIGCDAVIQLLNALNIPPGKYTEIACRVEDKSRVSLAEYKSKDTVKKRRKVIRGLKKQKDDKKKQSEGLTYATGSFSYQ